MNIREATVKNPTMAIDAPPGTKVLMRYPEHGYPGDVKKIAKYGLRKRVKYTVDHTDPHGFHTFVYLSEFPGVSFNSVHFCEP